LQILVFSIHRTSDSAIRFIKRTGSKARNSLFVSPSAYPALCPDNTKEGQCCMRITHTLPFLRMADRQNKKAACYGC
jgi:hypothetical protein